MHSDAVSIPVCKTPTPIGDSIVHWCLSPPLDSSSALPTPSHILYHTSPSPCHLVSSSSLTMCDPARTDATPTPADPAGAFTQAQLAIIREMNGTTSSAGGPTAPLPGAPLPSTSDGRRPSTAGSAPPPATAGKYMHRACCVVIGTRVVRTPPRS